MIQVNIYSKNGENGHYHEDGCDLLHGKIEMECLPTVGQRLNIDLPSLKLNAVVQDVVTDVCEHGNYHAVYVLILKH